MNRKLYIKDTTKILSLSRQPLRYYYLLNFTQCDDDDVVTVVFVVSRVHQNIINLNDDVTVGKSSLFCRYILYLMEIAQVPNFI